MNAGLLYALGLRFLIVGLDKNTSLRQYDLVTNNNDVSMFKLFENAVPPFPDAKVEQPPENLWRFIWHYARPFRFLLLALLFTSAIIAGIEVYMFSAIGRMIDWMQVGDPSTFFVEHGSTLTYIALLILVVWPFLNFVSLAASPLR